MTAIPAHRWRRQRVPVSLLLALGCGASLLAREQEVRPPAPAREAVPPVATAVRTAEPITLDGALSEPAWRTVSPLTSFTQRLPAEGEPASQATEVFVLFDDEHLYIGAELRDSDPGRIVAREMKEDGDLASDDLFGVLLDTFHDKRNGFYFEANPNGARADALIYDEGRTQSFDWDGVWEVASRVTDHGWTVEMAIPFKTLHFDPDKINPWGLQFWRLIRRNAEDAFWAPIPRSEDLFRVSRAGELRGLEGIHQGKSLALKPYALGGVSRRPTLGELGADGRADVGLDARYDITPNLAAVLTLNTDFAETEVDDQQVNTTRFSLFFPEKREFFLESTGYFDFGYNRRGPGAGPGIIPFFSRRIGLDAGNNQVPVQGGLKMAGRLRRYNLGFLTVNTGRDVGTPQTNYSVLRVSRDILTRSNWGFIGVSKEPAGPDDPGDPNTTGDDVHSNRAYGADLNFSVLQNLKFGGSALQTVTSGVSGSRREGNAYVVWSNDHWDVQFFYRDIDEGFRPEVGFVQRTGIEEMEGFAGWSWRSESSRVRRVEPHARTTYTMDQGNDLATRAQHWATTVEFRNGSEIEVGWNPKFDSLLETFVLDRGDPADPNDLDVTDNVEIRPGGYDMNQWLLLYEGDPSRVLTGSLFAEGGDFFDGRFWSADAAGTARISKHLRTSLSVHRTEINLPDRPDDDPDPNADNSRSPLAFNFTLIQGRVAVTLTTRMVFDALLQYNTAIEDFSSNLRFNFKYRPGSDIYVVYNERRDIEGIPTDTVDRTFTVKWTYLMAF
jgi:hypothetical protein